MVGAQNYDSFQGIEVSADFLKTIEEEKQPKHNNNVAALPNSEPLKKKFPFNRTTTPNSLREALRETLVRNVENKDLSDTIQSIKDDEIRDAVIQGSEPKFYKSLVEILKFTKSFT